MADLNRSAQIEADLRRQAQQYGRLQADEESALLERRDGDALDSLVKHNLDLVASQAEAHLGHGLTFADLYQEGSVGLVGAIAAYLGSGDFRDFASLHIGLQMDSLIESEGAARREAEADLQDVRALDIAQVALRRQLGREGTPAEMGKALGWDIERLEKVQANLEYARQENDAATLSFLDEAEHDELGVDFLDDEPDSDGRRRPSGAGPDE